MSKHVRSISLAIVIFALFGFLYSFILTIVKLSLPDYLPLSFNVIDIVLSLLLLTGGLWMSSLTPKSRKILLYILIAVVIELAIKSFIIVSKGVSAIVTNDLLIFILAPLLISIVLIICLTRKNIIASFKEKADIHAVDRIGRSYILLKTSASVLFKDKELLLYPILSLILSVIITVGGVALISKTAVSESTAGKDIKEINNVLFYILCFVYYIIIYFVGIFFNSALIKCASIRFKGGNPTFADGIKSSLQNIKSIFLWTLIASTIGLIFQLISEKGKVLGRIIGYFGNIIWSYAVLFVVPIMILEKEGVVNSIKKSSKTFVKRWGESIVGNISISVLLGIAMIVGIAVSSLLLILLHFSWVLWFVINILYIFFIIATSMALNGIYITALYNYASTGEVPTGFPEDLLKNSFVQKQ